METVTPITHEVMGGAHLHTTLVEMALQAKVSGCPVRCTFNEQEFEVKPGEDGGSIYSAWESEMERKRKEYQESPEGKAEEVKRQVTRAIVDGFKAEGILPFSVKDQPLWDKCVANNLSDYGSGVIRYSARWANYMEKAMQAGATVLECAKKCENDADVEGITGFMFSCALSQLIAVWEHGEELGKWHDAGSPNPEPREEGID